MSDAFSWKRGLKHAGLGALLAVIAAMAAAAAFDVADMQAAGKASAPIVLAGVAFALGLSWLIQCGKGKLALYLTLPALALVVLGAMAVVAPPPAPTIPLSAADKVPLTETQRDGRSVLVHPNAGFELERPPASFALAPSVAARFKRDPQLWAWAYADAATGEHVMIVLARGLDSPSAARSFMKGLLSGARIEGEVQVDWTSRPATFEASAANTGQDLLLTGLAGTVGQPSYEGAVMVVSLSPTENRFRALHDSLRLTGPPRTP